MLFQPKGKLTLYKNQNISKIVKLLELLSNDLFTFLTIYEEVLSYHHLVINLKQTNKKPLVPED